MFENRTLRKIFGPIRDDVTEWRELHNEELKDLYSSPNIIQVIKLRRMGWVGHVACTGARTGVNRVWWGNLRERDHRQDPGINRGIILRHIVRKWNGGGGHGLE